VPLEQLHETLQRLRRRRGLTQAELGERVGHSARQVARWETGAAHLMSALAFARLADVLATDAAEWDALVTALQRLSDGQGGA